MDRFKSLLHDFWLSPNTTIIIKVTITAPCFKDGDYTAAPKSRGQGQSEGRGSEERGVERGVDRWGKKWEEEKEKEEEGGGHVTENYDEEEESD